MREDGGKLVSPFRCGFSGRCPRCGEGALYDGFLDVADNCALCGLDYAGQNSGDGSAFFIVLVVGAVTLGSAFTVEVVFAPPIWLHMILWLPLSMILSFGIMRPAKGILIALQYKYGIQFGSD